MIKKLFELTGNYFIKEIYIHMIRNKPNYKIHSLNNNVNELTKIFHLFWIMTDVEKSVDFSVTVTSKSISYIVYELEQQFLKKNRIFQTKVSKKLNMLTSIDDI